MEIILVLQATVFRFFQIKALFAQVFGQVGVSLAQANLQFRVEANIARFALFRRLPELPPELGMAARITLRCLMGVLVAPFEIVRSQLKFQHFKIIHKGFYLRDI